MFAENIYRFSDFKVTESQLSELKSELIPLLEEVQDKFYLRCKFKIEAPFNSSMSMKDIFNILNIKNSYFFGYLFDIIDWYT